MSGVLRKRDYELSIIKHCKTLCFCKYGSQDDADIKRLIAYDLQKLGEIEHEKAMSVWNTKESRLAEKQAKKAI